MTLPTHLATDLLAFDRGDFDDTPSRALDFLGEMLRQDPADVPWRVQQAINKAIDKGHLSPAGDVVLDDHEFGMDIAELLD